MSKDLQPLRDAANNQASIKVLFAQDDWVGNSGAPPEQVIEINGDEYRTRSPGVIACLFDGSDEEDTDALSIASEEWLFWVNDAISSDHDVRFGLLEELSKEFKTVQKIYLSEKAAYEKYNEAVTQLLEQ